MALSEVLANWLGGGLIRRMDATYNRARSTHAETHMARPTVARIDLDALRHNVLAVRRLVGDRSICAAVKADAYGHGAPIVCHAMAGVGVEMFGVAMTEEALDLREGGIRQPIVLLTVTPAEDIPLILEHGITACIAEEEYGRELSAQATRRGTVATAHVNIDTGMHRVGLDWETAAGAILRIARLGGLRITGLFSHFACSDADDLSFSREQVRRFRSVLWQLRRAGMRLPFIHMANSGGVLRVPESYFDGVRPGLILYGLYPRPELRARVPLKPVLSLRTRIAQCKRIRRGEKIGYGHIFTAWRDSVIAALPIGYHDGYIRQFSNVGEVLVRGRRVPVVGRVCMDQALVDVTDVPDAGPGDEVVIYGEQDGKAVTIEEMAFRLGRIPYELICAVGRRVRREFVLNGQVVVETPLRSVVDGEALSRMLASVAPADAQDRGKAAQPGAA